MRRKNVLFMQSQTYYGADSAIHGLLMRYLDRQWLQVHAACNMGEPRAPAASLNALRAVPDLHIRPTRFGTSVSHRSKLAVAKDAITTGIPTAFSLASLAAYCRQHRIEIIHCTEKPRDAFYGTLLAKLTGARSVIHLHVKAENWISPTVRWSMRQADALIGVSEFVARTIVALGYPTEKTYHVLNSLDLNRWNDQEQGALDPIGWNPRDDGRQLRGELGIPDSTPLLAVVSRLNPWKGHTELLRALAQVREQEPNFKLLVVGVDDPRATPGGGSYSEELKALTATLKLHDHIIFTGFRRDIPRIMAACDIYAMPSFEEPFGMVYLEAMAMSKPVVALDNGGAREIIEHGKSGLLSPPKDVDALATNLLTLLRAPQLWDEMGAHGRRQVEESFTPQRMARDVEQIYRHILSPDTTRSHHPSSAAHAVK